MMKHKLAALCITAFALLLAPATAPAQQAEDIGNYRVHYNALNTNALPPEVAGAYGIQRSGSRAMLNIAVLRKAENADSMDTPTHARISARATNLTGQGREIELQEVEDDDAVYYIGTFRIHDEESLTFTISVQPEGSNRPPQEFSFQQQFFTD
ncbi:DUF4426 domain-containing protein [Wenzhouxiangella sp. EGI_FJ10305]|uniref:DUF4426 domain-containing protein n=1 Tax=Wenzhouxiangella sp. EGI_FJ10305 TaxID=3243768 RepID=UPI0035E35E00